MRAALAFHFSTVAAANGVLTTHHVPAAVGLVRAIAARFGVVVSDKVAVQMVPVLGAASGAVINGVLARYFPDVARGHFTIRDLERRYGVEAVETAYRSISLKSGEATQATSGRASRAARGKALAAAESGRR